MTLPTEARADFIRELDQRLTDPAGRLDVPSHLLLQALTIPQINDVIAKDLPKKPSAWDHVGSILGSMAGGGGSRHPFDILPSSQSLSSWSAVISHNVDVWKYTKHRNATLDLLNAFVIQRDTIGLTEREKALLRAMGALFAHGNITDHDWARFLSRMVWNDGKTIMKLPKAMASHEHAPFARDMLQKVLRTTLEGHAQFLEETTQFVARYRTGDASLRSAIDRALYQGARWLTPDDLANSRVYAKTPDPAQLIIGYHRDNGEPIRYSGDASLITIAAPGTGKTQAQVIPNLLTYPGSVFVLDVKGELWDKTAAHRQEKFGPVYRFSPSSSDYRSHSYNPFDQIAHEPIQAANGCQVLANQLVPGNPHSKDPYWDNRARDFLWAFAMLIALDTPPHLRNLASLTNLLSVSTNYEDNPDAIPGSPIDHLIRRLNGLGERVRLPELSNNAVAIRDGLIGTRLGSIFDTARTHLNAIARTPSAAAATSSSDWSPNDLRSRPGMSVYLTFKPGEMRAYASIIRLVFQQHADALTRDFTRSQAPPITFFLDELPQLGNLPSLNDLLDVGRGAGLRLWMFAQYLGQLKEAYDTRATGIVGVAQIRCFMQPDNEAAEFIAPQLGKTRNIVTGEERPLAEAHELSSRTYGDHTVVLARNEHPALLTNRFAYQTSPDLMKKPPPDVPLVLAPSG